MKPEEEKLFRDSSFVSKTAYFALDLIDKPITWFREKFVQPKYPSYYWYHEKVRRVPTIDECFTEDVMCQYEAEVQYQLDRKVDSQILYILRKRAHNCRLEYGMRATECESLGNDYDNALNNYFIKYGDLGKRHTAYSCYMKQKHRMAWERRHGPVGSGRKPEEELFPEKKTC